MIPLIRNSKQVTFNEDKQYGMLHTGAGNIFITTGTEFKIPYRGTSLYVKSGTTWHRLSKHLANKLCKFLKEVSNDHDWDYYTMNLSFRLSKYRVK